MPVTKKIAERIQSGLKRFAQIWTTQEELAFVTRFVVAPAVMTSTAALLSAQSTTRVSVDSNGAPITGSSGSISPDGRYVAFYGYDAGLGGSTLLLRDMLGQTTSSVPITLNGQLPTHIIELSNRAVSDGGQFITFWTASSNIVPGDTNQLEDVFVHDVVSATTTLCSRTLAGQFSNLESNESVISGDGSTVAFRSADTLLPTDTCPAPDVYVYNRSAGTLEIASISSAGGAGTSTSESPSISVDGSRIAFQSESSFSTTDLDSYPDIYVRDRILGTTTLVSQSSTGADANGSCFDPSISGNGIIVAFASAATSLVPPDPNGVVDVYVRDLAASTTKRASVNSAGALATDYSWQASTSYDGRFVAFESWANNLVPGDTNLWVDVFLRDVAAQTTERISVADSGMQANSGSFAASVDGDAHRIVFQSSASNLVPFGGAGVYMRDLSVVCMPAYSYCTAKTNSAGCVPSIAALGSLSLSGPDSLYVVANAVLNSKYGFLIWSDGSASTPFKGGHLCVTTPVTRTPTQSSGGNAAGSDCSGFYSFHFSHQYAVSMSLGAGSKVFCQYWYRDPGYAVPNNVGLTDAVAFTLCQ